MKTVGKKIIVITIIALLLVVGIIVILNRNKSSNEPNDVIEPQFKNNNFILDNFDLKKEHCSGSLCIKDLIINYNSNDLSTIKCTIYNNSLKTFDKCFKIVFNNSETDPWEVTGCYSNIEPQEEISYEHQFDCDPDFIINIDDYKLIEVSKEELK